MTQAQEAALDVLRRQGKVLPFEKLVDLLVEKTGADEATAKATILRLVSEGNAEITSEWDVQLMIGSESTSEAA